MLLLVAARRASRARGLLRKNYVASLRNRYRASSNLNSFCTCYIGLAAQAGGFIFCRSAPNRYTASLTPGSICACCCGLATQVRLARFVTEQSIPIRVFRVHSRL